MKTESKPPQQPEVRPGHPARLRLSDWIWQPWYARLWWAAIPIYWGDRWVSLKVPALMSFYETLPANYLALFCNPFILLLLLGTGFVRAKLDRGEWILTPDVPDRRLRPGDMSDPYTDPTDPRSGVRRLRHIGVLKDGVH